MSLSTPDPANPTPLSGNNNLEPPYLCSGGNFGNSTCTNTIYTIEKNVINKINDFYTKYAEFVRCSSSADTSVFVDNSSPSLDGSYGLTRMCITSIDNTAVTNAYNAAINEISKLNRATDSISDTSNGNPAAGYNFDNSFNAIKTIYANNSKLRNELDLKMKEILKTDDSFVNQSKLHYDSTMYASIGWTILATSLLYYVFRKL